MPETCEYWLGFVNSSIYYAQQTHEIYQALPYSVDYKASTGFEIHWVRQYLVNVVLFGIKAVFEKSLEKLSAQWNDLSDQ